MRLFVVIMAGNPHEIYADSPGDALAQALALPDYQQYSTIAIKEICINLH